MDLIDEASKNGGNISKSYSVEGDVKVIFTYVQEKESLDRNLEEGMADCAIRDIVSEVVAEQMLKNEQAANASYQMVDPFDEFSFASNSMSFSSQNGNSESIEENGDGSDFEFMVGDVVWGCLSKSKWYPCLIEELEFNGRIKVKYFNFRGPPGLLLPKNIFEFKTMDDFWIEIKTVRKDAKCKMLTKQILRAVAEAEIFLTFPIENRLRIFAASHRLKAISKDVNELLVKIENDLDADEIDLKDNLLSFFKGLQEYDEKSKLTKNKTSGRKRRSSSASERPTTPRYFASDRLLNQLLRSMNSSPVSKKEEDQESIASTPEKKPIIKKPKAGPEITLQERFLADVFDASFEYKAAPSERICEQCLDPEDINTTICEGVSCNKWCHQKCFTTEESNICEECSTIGKRCSACHQALTDEDAEVVKCEELYCKYYYHASCLKKKYPFSEMSCPTHTCHTCKTKATRKSEKLVGCIYCPAVYHPDVYCLPAGTQVLSKAQLICPRHKSADEKIISRGEKNVCWCCLCFEGGSIICCDGCPRSYHAECIQQDDAAYEDIFLCNACIEGTLPTYYSTVWVKVGNYRWWPAFVMLPWTVPLNIEKQKKFDRQFCVRFFGTSNYYFVTCEQVTLFDPKDMDAKTLISKTNNNKLDAVYNKAVNEAFEMAELLMNDYQRENFSKPGSYKRILINRPVPPVVLKKQDKAEIFHCNCAATDDAPCGKDSECLNRSMLIECSDECQAKEKCQNQQMKKRQDVKLEVIKTKMCGFGVICNHDIEANTFVVEYVGELIDKEEFDTRLQNKNKRGDKNVYFHSVSANLYVDSEHFGNKARFINHSCDPNCESRKIAVDGHTRIGIFSKQLIPSGTELTFNYKMEYPKSVTNATCFCGSSNCTGFIGRNSSIKKEK